MSNYRNSREGMPFWFKGLVVFSALIAATSLINDGNKRSSINNQLPTLQADIEQTLSGDGTTCLNNYPESFFTGIVPSFKDTFVKNVQNAENNLLSQNLQTRESAKQILSFELTTPYNNQEIYQSFFKKIAPIDPEDNGNSFDTAIFVEKIDSITKLKPSDFVKPERVAEALCEATFRIFKLIEDPKGNEWKNNILTFTAQGLKNAPTGMVYDLKTHTYRPLKPIDTWNTTISRSDFKINLASHQ